MGDIHVRFSSSRGGMDTPAEKTIFFTFLFYLHQRTLGVWRCGPSTLLDWWNDKQNQQMFDDGAVSKERSPDSTDGANAKPQAGGQAKPAIPPQSITVKDDPLLKDKHGVGLGATSRTEFLSPRPEYTESMQKKIAEAENQAALNRSGKVPSRGPSGESNISPVFPS